MKLRFEIIPEGRAHILLRAYPETQAEAQPGALAAWADLTGPSWKWLQDSGEVPLVPWTVQSNSYGAFLGTALPRSEALINLLESNGWARRR